MWQANSSLWLNSVIHLKKKKTVIKRSDFSITNGLTATPTHDAYLDHSFRIGLIVGINILSYTIMYVNILIKVTSDSQKLPLILLFFPTYQILQNTDYSASENNKN